MSGHVLRRHQLPLHIAHDAGQCKLANDATRSSLSLSRAPPVEHLCRIDLAQSARGHTVLAALPGLIAPAEYAMAARGAARGLDPGVAMPPWKRLTGKDTRQSEE